ncbi:sugar fermentation stimulation protein A [Methanobrevibacter cuticularis]|uniref:Sugar fermentation stimulation protein homolog n=1 Tax=Methanobrevibacter cuticularis TaxID=47311 RepID=A0A166CTS4_9EURY|nr:DNA/RNA nuclease SfsA [Methanobrevibacter cuticularis]KZX16747.1 sugar fermentation stimulation protein A [Methanobrevibacter cuticularis]
MNNYVKAIFKSRPNRFIANVEINGEETVAHVPNTGRCKELLLDGVTVYLLPSNDPKRKTKYTIHFVENNGVLVSIYSQLANTIVYDAIVNNRIKELSYYNHHSREKTVGNSRIDIHLSNDNGEQCYIEVKGVTLIENGIAKFPDAPTTRGKRHLEELIELKKQGHRAIVFFLIQHPNGDNFEPNWHNDPDFSQTLVKAEKHGVEILVYKTRNTLNKIEVIEKSLKYDLKRKSLK